MIHGLIDDLELGRNGADLVDQVDMKGFLTDEFLLTNEPARRLYHEFAASQPILDYHCHLRPQDIAENRRFENLFEIWLAEDHYKWRAMRANGVAERYCTGDATPYEKYLAWARTVPYTLRNPLYHWTHLELQRYFGVHELLDESSAPTIWERASSALAQGLTTHAILQKFRVEAVCTTDDPTDDLRHHKEIEVHRQADAVAAADGRELGVAQRHRRRRNVGRSERETQRQESMQRGHLKSPPAA